MKKTWLLPALALAMISTSLAAWASDPIYGTGATNKNQAYPTMVVVDPATGQPVFAGGSSNTGGTASDPQNAPYGQASAPQGATLTPGATQAATAARNIHIFCAPTTSPATGYTTLTEANGETHQVQLASGAQYDFPWAVTLVAAQTTVTGTLAACEFKNMN